MRFKSKIRIITFTLIAIMLVGSVAAAFRFLTLKYAYEWNYWKDLPMEIKVQAAELGIEYLWHYIFTPKPVPEKYHHISPELLHEALTDGADWIVSMQKPNGRFRYWYDPDKNVYNPEQQDNFLRQAGTSYSLALAYELTGKMSYLHASRKSLEYLMIFKRELDDKSYFLYGRMAKLGGVSLPMLTMLKIRSLTGDHQYDSLLHSLANMIIYLQDQYEGGQFKSTYVYGGDYEYEKTSGWESKVYPGEALLALAFMYKEFGDERYLNRFNLALNFYEKENWDYFLFLPWTISAITTMYEQTRDDRFVDFGFRLTDRLLTQQNLDPDDEVYGSFHAIPSANTGTYLEGLCDAIHLAEMTKDGQKHSKYLERAKLAYSWLLKLQYTSENTQNFEAPEKTYGGFRTSQADARLRIDYTQHAVSALAKGLRYVFKKEPAVTHLNLY